MAPDAAPALINLPLPSPAPSLYCSAMPRKSRARKTRSRDARLEATLEALGHLVRRASAADRGEILLLWQMSAAAPTF